MRSLPINKMLPFHIGKRSDLPILTRFATLMLCYSKNKGYAVMDIFKSIYLDKESVLKGHLCSKDNDVLRVISADRRKSLQGSAEG